jgi:hypothetical protein
VCKALRVECRDSAEKSTRKYYGINKLYRHTLMKNAKYVRYKQWPLSESNTTRIPWGKPQISHKRGTKSGTVRARNLASHEIADADFRSLINGWPVLPPAVKAGILAMVRAIN